MIYAVNVFKDTSTLFQETLVYVYNIYITHDNLNFSVDLCFFCIYLDKLILIYEVYPNFCMFKSDPCFFFRG